jgi:type II secretory ATPase GspE/PulE/Tfp pilus assembly ATPase PilB-like protein
MPASLPTEIAAALNKLDAASPLYATQVVEALLAAANDAGASDVHLQPTAEGLLVRWRIDGVLQPVGEFPRGKAADVVSRLKVLAELLTYRNDVPQEGRIRPFPGKHASAVAHSAGSAAEMRVSTFPTLHGERAVVRLFAGEERYLYLAELGLAAEIETVLAGLTRETSGAILLTGPAGSGKTTTAYACLREVVKLSDGRRSVVTLEDPIEVALPGVSQSQVQPTAGFTLATGLRSLMRQDPEVILVGEIRDEETVETVFQAALTGHLVVSTFHAGSAAGAVTRLLDMGIEPYLLTSGLRAVIQQRLVRRLCECAVELRLSRDEGAGALLGLSVPHAKQAAGCECCRHTGYRGRVALAEMLPLLVGELRQAILGREDTPRIAKLAMSGGMTTIFERARAAVAAGQTDPAEVRRVLGFVDETAYGVD